MRRLLIIAVVAAQLLVLFYMAGSREWILAKGETVYLRTAPIDPRDPFRGDFVRLNYEINAIGAQRLGEELLEQKGEKGRKVYTLLQNGEDGIAMPTRTVAAAPQGELFIRGRITDNWRFGRRTDGIRIKYGIEQLFVEQGKGLAIEKRRGSRNAIQVPMEVQVALGSDGTAVIKGYRWSRLGMRLELTRTPERRRGASVEEVEGSLSPRLKLTLQNVSPDPLILYLPNNHCGFKLVPSAWVKQDYRADFRGCDEYSAEPTDLITLIPAQEHVVEMDLSQPRWHMVLEGKSDEIGRLNRNDMFRMVYRTPSKAALTQTEADDVVWLGRLPSRAFNATGRLD